MNRALKQKLTNPVTLAFSISLLLLILGQIISPGFAAPSQIITLLGIAAFVGIVAAGQNLVVIGGGAGIDLSVGTVVTLGAILGGNVMDGQNAMILPALIAVLLATFMVGALNGVGVTFFRIPPLVMTLGMSIVVLALNKFITGSLSVGKSAPMLREFVIGEGVFGISGLLVTWIFLGVGMTFLLKNTRFGMSLFSVGANDKAARLSGVSVTGLRILTYGLCSMFTGFAGFLFLGKAHAVYNVSTGNIYTLPSIIAVVIGGTSLAGGQGGYIGVMAGALVLTLLESILVTVNIGQYGREIIFGLGLVILLFAYGRDKKLRA